MYKTIKSNIPSNSMFKSFYKLNKAFHEHETRHANDIKPPFSRNALRISSIRIFGATIWNAIPQEIRNSPSIDVFKKNFKSYLLDDMSNIIIVAV